ncbi:SMI1/KNR4 family protein [Chitinophaga sp. HK235]|uniref:SMI1/KNR4 family protein n=1 Tax=Chitinophaga sp. HK235 TaxID=2952571 RepID=UPI001BAC7600|nr:SMI1/KNR4 family protein [Chitinophaga sp. HK235]
MVTTEILSILSVNNIPVSEVEAFVQFLPRNGFSFLSDKELDSMLIFLGQQEDDLKEILPILTDNNSNFLCVFVTGNHKGQVCYLSHDEINLNPIFRNIPNLVKAINEHPDSWDVTELPPDVFDFENLPF